VILTTGHHQAELADSVIRMEPEVVESFERYVVDLKKSLESGKMREQI